MDFFDDNTNSEGVNKLAQLNDTQQKLLNDFLCSL